MLADQVPDLAAAAPIEKGRGDGAAPLWIDRVDKHLFAAGGFGLGFCGGRPVRDNEAAAQMRANEAMRQVAKCEVIFFPALWFSRDFRGAASAVPTFVS